MQMESIGTGRVNVTEFSGWPTGLGGSVPGDLPFSSFLLFRGMPSSVMGLTGHSSSKDTTHMWSRLVRVSQEMSVFHRVHYLFLHSPAATHGSKGVKVHLPTEQPPSFFAIALG